MPNLIGLLETSLYVADLGRAMAFYERVFGFQPMVADERFCAYAVADKQVLLLFERGATRQPMPTSGGVIPPHDGNGQLHVAFACTADELPQWEAHLAAKNVPIESRVRWNRGGTSLYFRDPDGHLIELATPGVWTVY